MQVEKYVKDKQVAILFSPGWGAGWSSWSEPELAYDKRVIEFWQEHKNDRDYISKLLKVGSPVEEAAQKLFKSWGYSHVYFGGFEDIKMRWLPEGMLYRIREYDGNEYLETEETIRWERA